MSRRDKVIKYNLENSFYATRFKSYVENETYEEGKTKLTGYPDSDAENDKSEHQKDDSSGSGKLRAHARHLPEQFINQALGNGTWSARPRHLKALSSEMDPAEIRLIQ